MRLVAGAERFSAKDGDMALQLWVDNSGHWFVDTDLGGVQVGQAYQQSDGTWAVEINDNAPRPIGKVRHGIPHRCHLHRHSRPPRRVGAGLASGEIAKLAVILTRLALGFGSNSCRASALRRGRQGRRPQLGTGPRHVGDFCNGSLSVVEGSRHVGFPPIADNPRCMNLGSNFAP
jgi:hypothetical protein